MTRDGVAALRAERDALVWWAEQLYDADEFWLRPSKVPGWSRLDVVAHLADLFHRVLDEDQAPGRQDTTARSDAAVKAARGRSTISVIGDYIGAAAPAIELLAAMQEPVGGDLLVHFGDAGQHPKHLWADGLVYEHLVHRCFDLEAGTALYESWAPSVAWILSSIPQVCSDLHAALEEPVVLEIRAPAEVTVTFRRVGDAVAVGAGASPDARAQLSHDPQTLVGIVSGRSDRRAGLDVEPGERDILANFASALRI